jgi:predicted RND superfamily exporter protein
MNQLTFFCGWLVIHSNRVKANRNSFLWCIKYKTTTKNECDMEKTKKLLNIPNGSMHNDVYKTTVEVITTGFIKKFFSNITQKIQCFYKFLITNNYGKCIVGLIFTIYISFSTFEALKIREGLDISDLVPDSSYFKAFTNENLKEFRMEPAVMMIIYEPIDYTNKLNRMKINKILNQAKDIDGINKDFILNWMIYFNNELRKLGKSNISENILKEISSTKSPYSNDVVIGYNKYSNRTQIIASRFYIKYDKVNFNSDDAKPMNKLKKLCSDSGLPILPYSPVFKFYEQFEETLPNILQAFVVAVESMFLISLIFIPDLISTICIVLSMISIMIGLIGFMNVWNLSLSSITMIELVMSVGFCVDFSAHLTHAFISGVGKGSRNERAYRACIQTGLPILNSALSSIIGVCALAFSESYLFVSFFKTLFIVMILGVFTSMFFLPVLLSLIGPHWMIHQN